MCDATNPEDFETVRAGTDTGNNPGDQRVLIRTLYPLRLGGFSNIWTLSDHGKCSIHDITTTIQSTENSADQVGVHWKCYRS